MKKSLLLLLLLMGSSGILHWVIYRNNRGPGAKVPELTLRNLLREQEGLLACENMHTIHVENKEATLTFTAHHALFTPTRSAYLWKIKGNLKEQEGKTAYLSAQQGSIDTQQQLIHLEKEVLVQAPDLSLEGEKVTFNLKEKTVDATDIAALNVHGNTMRANTVEIDLKNETIKAIGAVQMFLNLKLAHRPLH